jgi:hypothetical protein
MDNRHAFEWKNAKVYGCFITLAMKELQYMLLANKYMEKSNVGKQLTAKPFILTL